ncbi:MAG TPA: UDP-N-acetylmuramate dehydrogenase [Acidimicrobiales bacterium]|nr:UDP-N-acetylmuramate dehydrogenase [Acidimicrobiales bacterium]
MTDPAALGAAAAVLGSRARRDEPLGPRTTYRVGGTAALLLEVEGDDDLALAAEALRAAADAGGIPTLVVGNGSNLLVADAGFSGLALVLGEAFARIELDAGSATVRAGGAVALPVLARRTAKAGLRGLEWAVGVPGTVGGAVRMNAGGHGSDTAATLLRVRAFDLATGNDEQVLARDLDLGYRRSAVRPSQVVLDAEFQLTPGDAAAASAEVSEIVRWRRANQPGGQNAGSVFTNPPGDSAGRLVDVAGCRGMRLGSAEVSDKHANFIQADPDGRADDVAALIVEVQRRVEAETGVALHPEVRLVGFPDPRSLDPRSQVEG